MKLRSIIAGLLLAMATPLAAFAQCSGQAPASTYCGNQTGAQALPGWKQSRPIFIFASGQSNEAQQPAYSWTPPANAVIWNNLVNDESSVGTAFVPLDGTKMSVSWKLAAEVAIANPTRKVCLLTVAYGGQPISAWLSGYSGRPVVVPDVYAMITKNMSNALAACGVSTVDLEDWWQAETDVPGTTYLSDFNLLQTRLQAETWYPPQTPVLIHGISPTAVNGNANYGKMNDVLIGVANYAPDTRRFIYTASLPNSYWEMPVSGGVHMTAQGYNAAGSLTASVYMNGPGRASITNLVTDPPTGFMSFGYPVAPATPFTFSANQTVTSPAAVTGVIAHWIGAPNSGAILLVDNFGNGSGFSQFVGRVAAGTALAPTQIGADVPLVGLAGRGYFSGASSGYSLARASFTCLSAEIFTDTANGTYCNLFLTKTGTVAIAEYFRWLPGAMRIYGATSGFGTITAPAAAGSQAWQLPTNSGTFAVSASAPAVIDAATGDVTCPTCGVTGSPLSQFAATTSAQLAGVISDEVGTGKVLFNAIALNNVDNTSDATKNAAAVALTNKTNVIVTLSGGGIGYSTGAGCSVTQATSKATAVTCNGSTGQITMSNASLAAGTNVSFTVSDSAVTANDVIMVNLKSGAAAPATYLVWAESIAAGTFTVSTRNFTAGALAEALVVSFAIIRASPN